MRLYVFLFLLLILNISSCNNNPRQTSVTDEQDVLVVYVVDSFFRNDFSEKVVPLFEEKHKTVVMIHRFTDFYTLISQLREEKEDPISDVVIGIDNSTFPILANERLFMKYKSDMLRSVDQKYHFDSSYQISPINYSYYGIIYDSYAVSKPPLTFGKMQDGKWKNHLIIPDPRKSNDGLGMLLWSVSSFGENGFGHFWRSLKNNVLCISECNDSAYSMFLAGEAPMVISFSSLQAYHNEVENSSRFKTFIPLEGGYMFISGAGIVNKTQRSDVAKRFVDFMLSREYQQLIPTTQWMYPVNNRVSLPPSFSKLTVPDILLNDDLEMLTIRNRIDQWLDRWQEIMID